MAPELECRFKFNGTLNNGAVFILVDPQIALSCYAASSANLSSAQEALMEMMQFV
jgi:hypothetical protein